MAGKGQRRREKNYNAAHGGGNTRLPPPPESSSLDAVPSKLRKLMSLGGPERQPFNRAKGNTGNAVVDKGTKLGEATLSISTGMKRKRSDQNLNTQHDEVTQISMNEKKKKKKKNNKAEDLRLEAVGPASSKRKEHKKQRAVARKNKHKKSKSDEDTDFPGREEIRFGDVVKAPPKLTFVPKGFKTSNIASQERLRLQAVDAYRQRKGWASRPGVQLPSPVTTSPF